MQTHLRLYPHNEAPRDLLPLGSARGCSQRLECSVDPELYRTIQGKHVSFQQEGYGKYTSILTCQDDYPIAFNGMRVGQVLTMECLADLITPRGKRGEAVVLDRPAVPGSLRLCTPEGDWLLLEDESVLEGLKVILPQEGHLAYRPILHMLVHSLEQNFSEWDNKTMWTLRSVEI